MKEITDLNQFLNEVKAYKNREFRNEIDVYSLVEYIIQNNEYQLLEDISFSAKYIKGMFSIIQNETVQKDENYKGNLNKDISEAVEKFKELIKRVISGYEKKDFDSFYLRYLAMNQSAFSNLINLIDDFSMIKSYLNYRKSLK